MINPPFAGVPSSTPTTQFMFYISQAVTHQAPTSRGCAGNKRQSGHGWAKVARGIFTAICTAWWLFYAYIFICWADTQINWHQAMGAFE